MFSLLERSGVAGDLGLLAACQYRLNSTGANEMPEEIALVKVECNACFDQTLKYGF